VLGGKQAAILVPTTILAQQHYVTATRRFAKFPIRIAVVSRFSKLPARLIILRLSAPQDTIEQINLKGSST